MPREPSFNLPRSARPSRERASQAPKRSIFVRCGPQSYSSSEVKHLQLLAVKPARSRESANLNIVASIDPDTGELVVRIAYDGSTRAGKTTNIEKLSEKLKKEVFTPEQLDGSTLYFDWMKYKGGSFEGLPIRCEIVTVPGKNCSRSDACCCSNRPMSWWKSSIYQR